MVDRLYLKKLGASVNIGGRQVFKKRQVGFGTLLIVTAVVSLSAFVLGTRSSNLSFLFSDSQNKQLSSQLDLSSVQDVFDMMRSKYDGKLDASKLVDGAKKGMVAAAGDPYTTFFTDAEAKQFLSDLDGKFSGIGAELDQRNNHIVVVSTLDDSPARKAGLLPSDVILKVDDQDASGWSVEKVVSLVRGEKDTTVKLAIARGQDLKEFSIVRDVLTNPSVKAEITDDNIGYMRISRFANDTSGLAVKAADDFKAKKVRGVVLDLRGDGGGYISAAKDVASLWLRKKVIVEQRRGSKVTDTMYAGDNPQLEGIPTVVLVDSSSASASEIVAGALHDNKAATLVGQKTFGKGSVQDVATVPSGGDLKVTIAKWFTPNGKNISKEGIQPDVDVKLSDDDIKNHHDAQKDKALEILRNH
ncbi:MAG TPA: S41 family peptidase [Patescibacteria group bacterium]|nr:S41 family peptidase [Patescibacteria group bacterium]